MSSDLGLLLKLAASSGEIQETHYGKGAEDAGIVRAAWRRCLTEFPGALRNFRDGDSEENNVFLIQAFKYVRLDLGKAVLLFYNEFGSGLDHSDPGTLLQSFLTEASRQTGLSFWGLELGLHHAIGQMQRRGVLDPDCKEDQVLVETTSLDPHIPMAHSVIVKAVNPLSADCCIEVRERQWLIDPPASYFKVVSWLEPS
ncbi:MAG: hypothetical protein JNJ45_08255 [Chthonomonas sp.]|nr:hypothetical protein [Chthonomonas sp.]